MNKNKKIVIGTFIAVLIIVVSVVGAYKLIENSVPNKAKFNFTVEDNNSNTVETVTNEINERNNVITTPKGNTQSITFTKTYNVLNVADSNDEKYLYLTIRQYQAEEVATVKVSREKATNVETNKIYEFTFQYQTDRFDDTNIKSIFENTTVISITETDKTGMEQKQDSIRQ